MSADNTTKTIELKFPIVGPEKETIGKLNFRRRLTAGDFVGLNDPLNFEDQIKLISLLCDIPKPYVEKLDAFDFIKAIGHITFLFVGSQVIGENV